MRPVFCGNFDYDTRQADLERLFSKHGRIARIDMKSGYAFIYFEDERDAEDAIKRLANADFGYNRRRLSVEWSRQVEPVPKNRDRPTGDAKPTRTLFVINFDPLRTKIQDIERHFEPYGKISNIRIRKNFAFVRYETQEEASVAVKHTDKSSILDRVLTVEYAFRDDDNERDDRYSSPKRGDDRYSSPRRGDDRYVSTRRGDDRYVSPRRGDNRYGSPKRAERGRARGSPYMRSPSPRYRRDYSPDYDRRPRNAGYDRPREGAPYGRSRSPVYARYDRGRSPGYGRY
ncbi:serine/arginine-rich splicing factor RS31 [Brachypodium distachyon]|uniref:RRM domain-containing protein n=1 Tax=Brachypodium distachyon TaxID=15368 RepID=I1HAJ1_BRADI|nr:serine/arginine-rich splicing factor RS31 [Brachypodium distachyon]KQK24009.1 hypothetical protein BRADI_1g77520v3 [Brachypodium distachyon]KQK24010.1 hypothetical protein BRADI_1g77520v3 [Brachypodium distachyon]|eukprot:XP_010229309.1 serine/arginine-rich splicing factor RS31 [Brachypodium distachyon]